MKIIVMIFFITMFSIACQSQTDTIIKKDSLKFILNPFYFYSFKNIKNKALLTKYIFCIFAEKNYELSQMR